MRSPTLRWLVAPVVAVSLLVAVATPAARAAARTTRVTVTAGKPSEFAFKLSRKSVPVGAVVFTVVNRGNISHSFKVCVSPRGGKANSCKGKGTRPLVRGHRSTLKFVFTKKGRYEYLCTVPGHAAAGMKGDLRVT
jgi:uncharacterized cupredoxin-like copper-binding protein